MGQIRPIRWVGHTTMDCGELWEPSACYPVRIRTGAFGRNLPQRDLLLSPGHHVFVDGVLVPASALVNGITIVREPVGRVTYWHVGLDSHRCHSGRRAAERNLPGYWQPRDFRPASRGGTTAGRVRRSGCGFASLGKRGLRTAYRQWSTHGSSALAPARGSQESQYRDHRRSRAAIEALADGNTTLQVTDVRTLSMRILPMNAYAVEPAGAADTSKVEQAA